MNVGVDKPWDQYLAAAINLCGVGCALTERGARAALNDLVGVDKHGLMNIAR